MDKGAKGIGRFVCLKAYRTVKVDSYYRSDDGGMMLRAFELIPSGNGISDPGYLRQMPAKPVPPLC